MTRRQDIDPTNQAGNRRKANADNSRRLNRAAKEVLALWRGVSTKRISRKDIVNNTDFYEYGPGVPDANVIGGIISSNLDTIRTERPFNWYFDDYTETAYRGGTIQENAWIEVVLGAGATTLTLDNIIASDTYTASLELIQDAVYTSMRGLTETTTNQIIQVIRNGVAAGLSRTEISRQIRERFNVAQSSARRITDTEINRTYNDARMGAIDAYHEGGISLGVMHISALIPTTRPTHARRHGRVYSRQAQSRWWSLNANRINCHCSVRAARLTGAGQVADKDRQEEIREKGREFFRNLN